MISFLYNTAIALWVLAGWIVAGFGPSILLLPHHRKQFSLLVAPLIGMCLLTLLGLFEITVIKTPLLPKTNLILLSMISLSITCVAYRQLLLMQWQQNKNKLMLLSLIPLILVPIYAWMFGNQGYHLLVGSSDQLQYCDNANQILYEMHTGSVNDAPIPRQDHFVNEIATRMLPYYKNNRRGAETLLASTAATTNLSFEEAFPVVVLCALITLGFILAFIAKSFFALSNFVTLLLQFTFLSSFYFLLIHVQGSLALILSIAPCLVALAGMSQLISTQRWSWLFITAIATAGFLSIYSEPALINILIPSALLVLTSCCKSASNSIKTLLCFIILYCSVFFLTPYSVYSLYSNVLGNLLTILQHSPPLQANNAPAHTWELWNFASVVLGSNSYYSTSDINNKIASMISHAPWVSCVLFSALFISSLMGYVKSRNRLGYLFAAILAMWAMTSFIVDRQQDALRFMRSIEYSMPFMLFGLVLLANKNYSSEDRRWKATTFIGRIILTIFIGMNLITLLQTISFLHSHQLKNDPILLRFDERNIEWQQLREELQISANKNNPILISGFKETIRPLAIAIMIRDQPHVLGKSMLSFWSIYNPNAKNPALSYDAIVSWYSKYNTRLSLDEFINRYQQQNLAWFVLQPQLIAKTEQAVVPNDADYPVEWSSNRDVFAPQITRFPNICDVIYRNTYAVTLENNMVSSIMNDVAGHFRTLHSSGHIIINNNFETPKTLSLLYDGNISDVILHVNNESYHGKPSDNHQVLITASIYPSDKNDLSLTVTHPVKLRSMRWITHD